MSECAKLGQAADKYRSWNKAQLLRSVVKRDSAVKKIRNKVRKRAPATSKSLVAASSQKARDILAIERLARNKAQFSMRSFISIGVRRNMSNVSAQEFQHIALAKVSRWTVARAEVFAAAALQALQACSMRSAGAAPSSLDAARVVDSRTLVDWTGGSVIASVPLDSVEGFRFTCVTYWSSFS